MHSTWVFMVGCPVEWDLAFDVRNPNVGVMLDEQLRMLWVVVVCAPVQSCLLQGREVLKKATSASRSSRTSTIRQAWCKSHQDTLSEPVQPTTNRPLSSSLYPGPQLWQKSPALPVSHWHPKSQERLPPTDHQHSQRAHPVYP